MLKREGIAISMDGRGRAYDNFFVERLRRSVKHEDVYLKGYATMGELMVAWPSTSPSTTASARTSRWGNRHLKSCTKLRPGAGR